MTVAYLFKQYLLIFKKLILGPMPFKKYNSIDSLET